MRSNWEEAQERREAMLDLCSSGVKRTDTTFYPNRVHPWDGLDSKNPDHRTLAATRQMKLLQGRS